MPVSQQVIALLQYLLPGFLAAWIFYGLTSYAKPSNFERVIQALIFTLFIQGMMFPFRPLAALLSHHATHRAGHIITVEAPIEFVHHGSAGADGTSGALFSQREVHRDTRSFPDALRAALRTDPDVVMVGEVRDTETMRLALTAAETGHLVMATLHTASAARSVGRVTDFFSRRGKTAGARAVGRVAARRGFPGLG